VLSTKRSLMGPLLAAAIAPLAAGTLRGVAVVSTGRENVAAEERDGNWSTLILPPVRRPSHVDVLGRKTG